MLQTYFNLAAKKVAETIVGNHYGHNSDLYYTTAKWFAYSVPSTVLNSS